MNTPTNIAPAPTANSFGMRARLPQEVEQLRQAGVRFVEMNYDGKFGDVDVSYVRCLDAQRLPILPEKLWESVRAEVRILLLELLELRFPGWEIAEGARGEFQWDVERDLLRQRHEVRYIEYRAVEIPSP